MKNFKGITVLSLLVAFSMIIPVMNAAADGQDVPSETKWTILMYFGADNDLYQATEFSMEQALKGLINAEEYEPAELAVVVLIDGPTSGDTKVYELTADGKVDRTVDALGPGNPERTMTDPQTLTDFVTWAMSTAYPADNTMLILKNGHAWCGICPDVTDNQDEKLLMPIEDIKSALETVYINSDLWVDAIVFDGDNMGSIEVAYELRKVTDYFVGSQQQVPLEGLPYYLFIKDLAESPDMDVEDACIRMVEDYVLYYNNTDGNKPVYDKLLSNSQMSVTGAVFRMGADGEKIEAVVNSFNNYVNYMLTGNLLEEIEEEAKAAGLTDLEIEAKLNQWYYPDPTTGELVWSWIPLSRNNISSARDCALIGKMSDQQGYEWLPDAYTWLWSISALSNYEAYGDPIPPSGDVIEIPGVDELKDPFVRLYLEDLMEKWGYQEPGIYRGVLDPTKISANGALIWISQSQILDRSGNSFPHGLNIWFPPTWLQWDEDNVWSLLFTKEMTYAYNGIEFAYGDDAIPVYLPAEYYCIDCPVSYDEIGLDFTTDTSWMDFFAVYYDSRWLIYSSGQADYPVGPHPQNVD